MFAESVDRGKLSKQNLEFLLLSPGRVGPQEVKKHHTAEHGDGHGGRDAEDGEAAQPGVHGREHQQLQLGGQVSVSSLLHGRLVRGTGTEPPPEVSGPGSLVFHHQLSRPFQSSLTS